MSTQVYDYLLKAAAEVPDAAALEFMGQPVTYGRLADNARKVASGLEAQGIAPGASLGLMLPNIPQFVEALYGSWLHKNVVVPISVLATGPELRYLIEDSKIKALFVFEMFLPQVEAGIADLANPPKVFVVGNPGKHTPYGALLENPMLVEPPTSDGRDTHVLTIYTSGTTGKPKGAVISNNNVIAQIAMADDLFPAQPDDRSLCVLPLFHVFAMNGVLNISIKHRTTVVLHPKFDVQAALQSLQNDRITIFSGVPTMYFYLLKFAGPDTRFPHLRYCVSGGSALPVEVLHSWEDKFHVPIYEGYGLTETTVSVCCSREGARRVGSVGKPYPSVQLKIVDDANREVPTKALGEIIVKGANIMQGYLNKPEATAEAIVDGWLHTGDIGYVDEDGFVFIVDRKKDMIIKGGYNIYPREIEEVLYQMPQVAEAAVVGIKDEAKGEQVRAVISVRPGAELNQETVNEYLSKNLAKYKLPAEYRFVSELPKGPTGKILKRELRN
ncbi:MAG TPA: AMP-binding protein [Polyangiales bacterium]|nr:AMP-binding protein [Polyangiales bacterium]